MNRAATTTIVVVLAISAGITAAAGDVLASYFWRPLPYPASGRLMAVDYPRDRGPSPRDLAGVDAAALSSVAELAVASEPDSFTVLGGDVPFTTDGRWIGADVFAMFGVSPVRGRTFTPAEARGGERVVMIGHRLWQAHFGGRDDVIGQTITVRATIRRGEAERFTVIGILPERFWHVDERTSLLLPLRDAPPPVLMRLQPGVAAADAALALSALIRAQVPRLAPEWSVVVQPARDAHVAPVRSMLAATGAAIVMLALIAAANLAFLQLARGVGRQREMAVRTVMGASRGHLIRDMLFESVRLGAFAATLACVIAFALLQQGLPGVERFAGRLVPGGAGTAAPLLYAVTFLVTIGLSIGLGAIMLAASRSHTLAIALSGNSSTTDTSARLVIRQVIVVAQVAVAFVMLVGAALMIRTAWHVGQIELGFQPDRVLSTNVTLPESRYRRLDDRREFFRSLTSRLEQIPEIEHTGLTGWLPFRVGPSITVLPEGQAALAATSAAMQGVDPGYFRALQLRLLEGRLLNADDRSGRDNAAVIGQSLARELWPDGSAVGRAFRIKFSAEPGRGFGPYTIVGVVADVRQSVMRATPPQMYLAFYQQPLASNAFLQVRTRVEPLRVAAAVERAVRDLDPELPLGAVTTLDAIVDAEGLRPRQLARALAAFASMATVVALIGLYSVSVWMAQRRRREVALRVALGAGRTSVIALLAGRGLIAVTAGLVLGWMAAWPVTTMLAGEMRGVTPNDVATRLLVAMVLMASSAAALLVPVRAAATINLTSLLRES